MTARRRRPKKGLKRIGGGFPVAAPEKGDHSRRAWSEYRWMIRQKSGNTIIRNRDHVYDPAWGQAAGSSDATIVRVKVTEVLPETRMRRKR